MRSAAVSQEERPGRLRNAFVMDTKRLDGA